MSTQVPSTIRAFTADEGHKGSVKEISTPKLEDNEILIKVAYAAQNPTDWKHLAAFSPPGAIGGCDLSGTVAALGPNLSKQWNIGDKVAFAVHGGLYDSKGAFAEYARAASDLVFAVPESLKLDEASTFGIGWGTALQALVLSQGHQWPGENEVKGEQWYLVYGASSSVGLFAVQLAKALGYRVVAVAGSKNHELVRSYGADETVDYKDAEAAISKIKEITGGGVSIGLDTISEGNSFEIAVKSFKEGGGRLNAILWANDEQKAIRKDVEIVTTLMYTLFGKPFTTFGKDWPVVPADHEFGKEIGQKSTAVIEKFKIKGNPVELRGGLDAVKDGLEHQKAGKVSAQKLVYKIAA